MKKKQTICLALASVGIISATALLLATKPMNFNVTTASDHTITLTSGDIIDGDYFKTTLKNTVHVDNGKAQTYDDKHLVTINKNSYFGLKDEISGMESIKIKYTGTIKSLDLKYQYGEYVDFAKNIESNVALNVADIKPNYFTIVTGDSDVAIESITIDYACVHNKAYRMYITDKDNNKTLRNFELLPLDEGSTDLLAAKVHLNLLDKLTVDYDGVSLPFGSEGDNITYRAIRTSGDYKIYVNKDKRVFVVEPDVIEIPDAQVVKMPTKIYAKLNSEWSKDLGSKAHFMYFFDNKGHSKFVATANTPLGICGYLPTEFEATAMILVRKEGGQPGNWNNKLAQTGNIVLTGDNTFHMDEYPLENEGFGWWDNQVIPE